MTRAALLVCAFLYLIAAAGASGPMRYVMLSYAVANTGLAWV